MRASIAVGCIAFVACGSELVPTEKMPIVWVRNGRTGNYEKGMVSLDGWTCGEQYRRAVSGNGAAEEKIESCSRYMTAYGVLMSSFVLAIPTGITLAFTTGDSHAALGATAAVGLGSFAVGLVMGYLGGVRLRDAVHLYNGGVTPAPP